MMHEQASTVSPDRLMRWCREDAKPDPIALTSTPQNEPLDTGNAGTRRLVVGLAGSDTIISTAIDYTFDTGMATSRRGSNEAPCR